MEPMSLIIGALVAGSTEALKDTASQAVKDAYQGLKTLIIDKWGKKEEAKILLDNHEQNPEPFRPGLESKLSELELDQDQAIIQAAEALLEVADPEGTQSGKYQLTITGSSQFQVGDGNTQTNQ
mgnify:CR=1 FL=1